MAEDVRGTGPKPPARVEVLFFPKPARRVSPQDDSLGSDGSTSQTVTEYHPRALEETPATPEPPSARKATPKPAPASRKKGTGETKKVTSGSGKSKERRRKGKRKSGSGEPITDPTVELPADAPDPAAARASAQQVARLSLFGHQLFERGSYDEARVVFEGLVGMNVQEAFPHTMLGTVYLAMGRPEEAFALFEAALQLDRNDLAALVYRGEIQLWRGKLKVALMDLNRAMELGLSDDPFVLRARQLARLALEKAKQQQP